MKLLSTLLAVSGCAVLVGLSGRGAIATHPPQLLAQNDSCYMVTASGMRLDLGTLCSSEPTGPSATAPTKPALSNPKGVFQARIKRREQGTPVIDVVFNGNQTFEMIVDTGASNTMITPRMAAALRVKPVAKAKVSTASDTNLEFPVGYVDSISVDGVTAKQVLVIVGTQDIGLLGHDFFGDYDITLKRDTVEFRYRN